MRTFLFIVFALFTTLSINAQVLENQLPLKFKTPRNYSATKAMFQTKFFVAPEGHYIIEAKQNIISQSGICTSSLTPSYPDTLLVEIEAVRQVYQEQKTLISSLEVSDADKSEMTTSIEQLQKTYEEKYFQLNSSHSVLVHVATLSGQGRKKGPSSYHADVTFELIQSAPEFENMDAFTKKAKADFQDLLRANNLSLE